MTKKRRKKPQVKSHERSGASQSALDFGLAVISFVQPTARGTLFDPCRWPEPAWSDPKSFWKAGKPFFKKVFAVLCTLASTKF